MEEQAESSSEDQGKIVGVLSYLTFIGWIVSFVIYSTNEDQQSPLAAFHIRQSLGIFITGVLFYPIFLILMIIPILGWLLALVGGPIVGFSLFVFWIIGFIGSINGTQKKVPVVGDMYQNLFSGLG